jgi:hypothetical protein
MKRALYVIVTLFICLSAKAQSDSTVIVRVEDRYDDKLILELTNDMWLDLPEGVELEVPSIGFKAHFYSDYTFGRNSNVSFAWGIGISADNVHSNAALVQEEIDGETGDQMIVPFDDDYEYEKNKHATTYLELPLELRYIGKGRSAFRFAVGFRVGYLLGDKQKLIDSRGKRKIYDFEHITTFRYGVNARIGVGKVALTAFYSLTPLIEEGKGTQVIPFSVGIAFIPIR